MISKSLLRVGVALVTASVVAFGMLPRVGAQAAGRVDPALYSGLKWRMVGPFRAGRVNAVTGVPGDPNTFYFGSVGGGVWKSTDAGRTWDPIFDHADVASIGAIAVAPSNTDVVYVGSGEADMRDSIQYGDGMYKSTDAGKTWTHIGLDNTRQIGRVIVDPHDPNLVFVAALGHAYAPNPDRGVYRSHDGGATWQKVLFKGDTVGAIDITFDPSNSKTIYAALWAVRRPPWFIYAPANEPGSGIFKSTDGGDHWTQLTSGLPSEGVGRIGLGISASNPQRVYAIIDGKDCRTAGVNAAPPGQECVGGGGLYRSDDAGATWTLASNDQRIWTRGWYFETVTIDPKNADVVYIPNTGVYKSTDGGKTWGAPIKAAPGGDDYHNLWIAPEDPNRMILASDQGTVVSVNGARTWSSWYNQPTAQLYHVAADYRFPYWLTAAQQDSGAVTVPIRAIHAVISMHEWTGLCAGGESGYTAPDPLHPEIVFGGTVEKCNVVTGATKNVSPERGMPAAIPLGGAPSPEAVAGAPRHDWTQPLVFSQADPHALYFADQFVFKTTDGGENWTRISEDLTREDPGVPPNIDAVAAQDAPPDKRRGVVYTIAPSPLRAPLLWIGTDDGLVKVTPDDGKTWNDVTPKDMTSWTKVVMIDASHFDANEAFVAAERHQLEDYAPHIWRTRDGGKSWQTITKGLPAGAYVQTVKEDPVRRGLLYCGTERAVYVSFDDGDNWQSLQLNLPPTSMRDLAIKGDDLLLATHGRGFWALDDMSLLRQVNAESAAADAILFKPSEAIEIPAPSEFGTPLPKDEPFAENPPTGAILDYYLKSAASGPVTLEVLDGSGAVVRRYSSEDRAQPRDPNTLNIQTVWAPTPEPLSAEAGMHRWVWDLRAANAGGGRGRGGAGRGGAGRGAAQAGRGAGAGAGAGGGGGFGRGGAPIAAGTYTVRLTVNGKTYTQPLVVKADPRGTL